METEGAVGPYLTISATSPPQRHRQPAFRTKLRLPQTRRAHHRSPALLQSRVHRSPALLQPCTCRQPKASPSSTERACTTEAPALLRRAHTRPAPRPPLSPVECRCGERGGEDVEGIRERARRAREDWERQRRSRPHPCDIMSWANNERSRQQNTNTWSRSRAYALSDSCPRECSRRQTSTRPLFRI